MVKINYLDNSKTIDIITIKSNGEIQEMALSFFHLDIEDIQCLIYVYDNEKCLICGHDISFYSNIEIDNLININIITKNETHELLKDIDIEKIKNTYCTFLISRDDETYIQENLMDHQSTYSDNPLLFSINPSNNGFSNNIAIEITTNFIPAIPNETIPNEGNSNETTSNEENPNEGNSNEGNPNEGNPNERNPNEGNPIQGNPIQENIIGHPSLTINSNMYNNLIQEIMNPSDIFLNTLNQLVESELNTIIQEEELEDVKIVISEEEFNKLERTNESKEEFKEELKCAICFDEMSDNIIKLKCNHYFHEHCIKEWLCKCNNKCPICKQPVADGIPLNI